MLKSDLFPIMNICRLQMQSFLSGDCLHISIFHISCKHYLFYDISSSLPVHFRKREKHHFPYVTSIVSVMSLYLSQLKPAAIKYE